MEGEARKKKRERVQAGEAPPSGAAARVRQQKLHSQRPPPPEGEDAPTGQTPPPPRASEKAAKKAKLLNSVYLPARVLTPADKSALAFESDWHDHCETPFEAYRDIEPLLFRLAEQLGCTKATLRIYDPYFCEGSMVQHLGRLGFADVHNRNEDCYRVWSSGRTPQFDVLITNPPYSSDHMQRILAFAVASGKPWLLLLPNFVAFKKNFRDILSGGGGGESSLEGRVGGVGGGAKVKGGAPTPVPAVSFLVPSKRYVYYAPGRSQVQTQATSPFDSFWYLSLGVGGSDASALLDWYERKYARASGTTLARSVQALPPLVTPVRDEKRANPAARRRAAKRAGILHQQHRVAHAHIRPARKGGSAK